MSLSGNAGSQNVFLQIRATSWRKGKAALQMFGAIIVVFVFCFHAFILYDRYTYKQKCDWAGEVRNIFQAYMLILIAVVFGLCTYDISISNNVG